MRWTDVGLCFKEVSDRLETSLKATQQLSGSVNSEAAGESVLARKRRDLSQATWWPPLSASCWRAPEHSSFPFAYLNSTLRCAFRWRS